MLKVNAKLIIKKGEIANFDTLPFIKQQNFISKEIRENLIRNHIDSTYITMPLLGIKIGINDILILMGFTFFILIGWLFFCVRAENLTIGKILTLNKDKSIAVRSYVFYGICFNNLFFKTTQRHKPYSDLSNCQTFNNKLNEISDVKRKKKGDLNKFVFFIPLLIMFLNLGIHITDIMSINGKFEKKYTTITLDKKVFFISDSKTAGFDINMVNNKFHNNNPYNSYLLYILWLSLAFTLISGLLAYKTFMYQKGTSNILYKFKQQFKHDEDCMKGMKDERITPPNNIELHVKKIHSNILFGKRKLWKEKRKLLISKHDEKNGFLFITHSGNPEEAFRINEKIRSLMFERGIEITTMYIRDGLKLDSNNDIFSRFFISKPLSRRWLLFYKFLSGHSREWVFFLKFYENCKPCLYRFSTDFIYFCAPMCGGAF